MTGAPGIWLKASLRAAAWAPLTVVVLHFGMAKYLNLYAEVPSLDVYEHFIGGVAIAFFFWRSYSLPSAAVVVGSLTRFGRMLFTISSVCAAAVVWEFSEWITDQLGWTHAQATLGDTLADLLLGITGAVVFLLFALRRAD